MIEREWKMRPFQFEDLADALKRCGQLFIRGVVGNVAKRTKPDGSPQKQNAESTIKRKKHDHPLVERQGRFQKASTYQVQITGPKEIMIMLPDPVDSEIGARVEEMGYKFFGPTEAVSDAADRVMAQYLDEEVLKATGGRRV